MRKIVLIFVTVVLPCLLCARNDDKSTDALLRQIDGIIKNRQTYGAEKEARIADLKKLLSEATSDEQRYGFCGRLFDEYRAYNLDSSYVYAQRKQNLASHMGKQDYLDDSAMNMAEVMGTTGMYKEALEQLGQIDKKTLPDYLYSYLLSFISYHLWTDGRLCRHGKRKEGILPDDRPVSGLSFADKCFRFFGARISHG